MSSPATGPEASVPIEVAGRKLHLRYGLDALLAAQEALGLGSLAELLARTDKFATALNDAGEGAHAFYDIDLKVFSVMLWAGSRKSAGDKPLTAGEIAESILIADYPTHLLAVATAMTLSIRGAKRAEPEAGEPAGEGANPPPAAAAA